MRTRERLEAAAKGRTFSCTRCGKTGCEFARIGPNLAVQAGCPESGRIFDVDMSERPIV
ncbi:MAG: hypothetical protein IKI61_10590 [Erysipelotrichaceae bacterium]|nr:hypothetical protein [Erysipelotrichaceae bacterium]